MNPREVRIAEIVLPEVDRRIIHAILGKLEDEHLGIALVDNIEIDESLNSMLREERYRLLEANKIDSDAEILLIYAGADKHDIRAGTLFPRRRRRAARS